MSRLPRAPESRRPSRHEPLYVAFAVFLAWTAATWLLEGRIQTLLRPDAVFDRLLYTGIANIGIGQLAALAVLGWLFRWTGAAYEPGPSSPFDHRLPALGLATILGLAHYAVAGGASGPGAVLVNAFAQVFVVSAAEVIVCWGLLGFAAEHALRPLTGRWAPAAAALMASMAFGVYHFAHSAPFDTLTMVVLLTVVGLITSVFFFVTRDLLATIVFHNFPAMAGVTRVLSERGEFEALTHLQPLLLATAALCLLIVVAGERFLVAAGSRSPTIEGTTRGGCG